MSGKTSPGSQPWDCCGKESCESSKRGGPTSAGATARLIHETENPTNAGLRRKGGEIYGLTKLQSPGSDVTWVWLESGAPRMWAGRVSRHPLALHS